MTHYFTDNSNLESKQRKFTYYFDNEIFTFITDKGVFSKDGVDFGSYLLVKNTYKINLGSDVLDLGCGYGPIGIIIKHFQKDINLYMVDVNSRAIELAKKNLKQNKIVSTVEKSQDITSLNRTYDSILLNPPIRAGKEVIYKLYEDAYKCLNPNGKLYIVIQKKHGMDSTKRRLEQLFEEVKVIDREKGYYILQSCK